MKRLLVLPVLLLTLLVGNPVFSADFQKGLKAYQQGDYATALKEWKPLAEQGHAKAQAALSLMCIVGEGTVQDYVYAHMWLSISASEGVKIAVENREIVARKMTPSQIAKAQQLASECVKKNYKGC